MPNIPQLRTLVTTPIFCERQKNDSREGASPGNRRSPEGGRRKIASRKHSGTSLRRANRNRVRLKLNDVESFWQTYRIPPLNAAIGARTLTTPTCDGKKLKRLICGGFLGQTSLGHKETSAKLEEAGA